MNFEDRFIQIENGLKGSIEQKDGPQQFLEVIKDMKDSMKGLEEMGTDLELVFRRVLTDLLSVKAAEKKSLEEAGVLRFLNFTIDYSLLETQQKEKPVLISGKLPYLVLEDVLDGSPLASCKEVWALMESRTMDLTTAQLFQRGKLILLRICNSLLRRLSKTSETEFCGRVLLYLAAAYPLSERSAVNVTGKANTANITTFEEEEEFKQAMVAAQAEKNSAEKTETDPDAMDTSEEKQTKKSTEGGTVVDYPFYRAFWGIQSFFCDPSKGGQSKALLDELAANMDSVLTAFEANSFSAEDLTAARERFEMVTGKTPTKKKRRKSSMGSAAMASSALTYKGLAAPGKYLTDSQLMHLQLTDPQLRLAYLTQFLLISQFLAKMKGLAAGLKPEVTLKPLEKRARSLLEKTPPNGKEYLQILEHILAQEVGWMEWKANGCKPYEKYGNDQLASKCELKGATGKLKRRKRPTSVLKPSTINGNKKLWTLSADKMKEGLMAQAMKMAENKPELNKFLEPYEDAMDPEAGIEDEYHPKHDVVFCWRGLRLLAEEHLSFFSDMSDGDLAKGITRLCQTQGRPVPGQKKETEPPANPSASEAETEEPTTEKEEKSEAASTEKDEAAMETEDAADQEKSSEKETVDEETNGHADSEVKETSEEDASKDEVSKEEASKEEPSKEEPSKEEPSKEDETMADKEDDTAAEKEDDTEEADDEPDSKLKAARATRGGAKKKKTPVKKITAKKQNTATKKKAPAKKTKSKDDKMEVEEAAEEK